MQGAGHAAVVHYRKCIATQPMWLNRYSLWADNLELLKEVFWKYLIGKKSLSQNRIQIFKILYYTKVSRLSVQDSGGSLA